MSDEEAREPEARPYSALASIYDGVMRDVNYSMWVDYIEELCHRHGLEPETVLDVACGTGNSTLPFARRGYRVAGVDSSEDMVAIARMKAASGGLDVEFAVQDMRELHPERLEMGPVFDLVLCLYDSINYLTDPREFARALLGFREAVRPGGFFVFDVNAARRLSQMTEASLFLEGPGWAFVEENQFTPSTSIWRIRVTGFIEERDGLYRRFREVHHERAYSQKEVAGMLAKAGWSLLGAYNAFGFEPASPDAARIYFVAQRPE